MADSSSFAAQDVLLGKAARRYSLPETIVTEKEFGVPLSLLKVSFSRWDEIYPNLKEDEFYEND